MGKFDVVSQPKIQEEKMAIFNHNIVVKNTFFDLDDEIESESHLSRQWSAPAVPTKTIWTEPIKSKAQDAPVDPAGPEPEPGSEPEPEENETEEDQLTVVCQLPSLKWDRIGTGERWANMDEAEEPEEPLELTETPVAEVGMAAHANAAPFQPMGYGGYFVAPYTQDGYGFMAPPDASCVDQAAGLDQKRRRRRAGNSLIDIAKKRMQEAAVQPQGPVIAQGIAAAPAASPAAAPAADCAGGKVCGKCDLKFAAMFKFCYSCGGPLAEAE
jgi:hypothetical protein